MSLELANLNRYLSPDITIYTTIKHAAKSGLSREVGVLVAKNNTIYDITHHVANVLQYNTGKHGGIIMKGCGLDVGYALVDAINHVTGTKYKHSWLT